MCKCHHELAWKAKMGRIAPLEADWAEERPGDAFVIWQWMPGDSRGCTAWDHDGQNAPWLGYRIWRPRRLLLAGTAPLEADLADVRP